MSHFTPINIQFHTKTPNFCPILNLSISNFTQKHQILSHFTPVNIQFHTKYTQFCPILHLSISNFTQKTQNFVPCYTCQHPISHKKHKILSYFTPINIQFHTKNTQFYPILHLLIPNFAQKTPNFVPFYTY